jgi:hypothetical protein
MEGLALVVSALSCFEFGEFCLASGVEPFLED